MTIITQIPCILVSVNFLRTFEFVTPGLSVYVINNYIALYSSDEDVLATSDITCYCTEIYFISRCIVEYIEEVRSAER